jgi:farnesyl-diphosphate farnesyltransferase
LPRTIREPISLAYLLARLTDTFADCNNVSVDFKKNVILQFKALIHEPANLGQLAEIKKYVTTQLNNFNVAEKLLIEAIPLILTVLNHQSLEHQQYICELLDKIIEGQLIDLGFFDNKLGIIHFTTDEELDNYLYLVAGCVGEFWTKICLTTISRYSKQNLDYLLPKAINFGKALQLTNILRDIPEDLKNGRFYLPIFEANNISQNKCDFLAKITVNQSRLIENWRQQALNYLNDADLYIQAVKNRRVKFACLVPFYLAQETLNLLKNQEYIQKEQVVKISRKQVYKYLVRALFCIVFQK